jgi:hypothetical protein
VSDDDPNEAYEVVPIEPGPHGPPKGWWTVKRNGMPVRHFPGKEKAERYATDPQYRASLAAGALKAAEPEYVCGYKFGYFLEVDVRNASLLIEEYQGGKLTERSSLEFAPPQGSGRPLRISKHANH